MFFKTSDESEKIKSIGKKAVSGEMKAIAFYSQAALKANLPTTKKLFTELARIEKGHFILLRDRFGIEAKLPDDDEILKSKWEFADYQLYEENEEYILIFAMKEELKAKKNYEEDRDKIGNKKIKETLEKLASDEQSHYEIMRGVFVQLTGKEPAME